MATYVIRRSGLDWTFELLDRDGQPIVQGMRFSSRDYAARAIEELRAAFASPESFGVRESPTGLLGFIIRVPPGLLLARSPYYSGPDKRDAMIAKCRDCGTIASVVDEVTDVLAARSQSRYPEPHRAPLARSRRPTLCLETLRDTYRLILADTRGRPLLSTSTQPFAGAALALEAPIREHGAREEFYRRVVDDDGLFTFRLVDSTGLEIAFGMPHHTPRVRDERIRRAVNAAAAICALVEPQ